MGSIEQSEALPQEKDTMACIVDRPELVKLLMSVVAAASAATEKAQREKSAGFAGRNAIPN